MKNRSLKIFIIFALIVGGFYFLFHHYLPSKISAMSDSAETVRVKNRVESKTIELEKQSIANELGVPKPKRISYNEFNPKNIKKQKRKIHKIFEIPEGIRTEVNFWIDVYTKYDKSKIVFHDKADLGKIYSVLDISNITENENLTDEEKWRRKKERVKTEKNRILATLESKKDKANLRSQTGIKDKFKIGLATSGKYLGEIEKIFAEYGVPLEITRLAFVESMFNLEALSKVGASGIWQFMPSSGRLFLNMNKIVDERNDPILATHAAAKHLRRDYDILNSWPLAINSYNSGRGRLSKAISRLGTKDIAVIIKKYNGSGYGFASRNFYPAFLAALYSFENREKYFPDAKMDPPLEFDILITPFFATLPDISKITGVPVERILEYNPHFQEEIIGGKLPIPKNFELKTPPGLGEDFLVAINRIREDAKFEEWHIVSAGESLKSIAAKYNTNTGSLKKINHLRKHRVKPGLILKLPKTMELAKD